MSAVEAVQPSDEINRAGPKRDSEDKRRWITETTLHITSVLLIPAAQILQGCKVKNISSKEGFRKIWTTVHGKLLVSVQKAKDLVDKYMEERAA